MKSDRVGVSPSSRMKLLSLLAILAFACSASAQEPSAPEESKAKEKPAETKPAEPAPLPEPSPLPEQNSELLRNQPGEQVKPAPQRETDFAPGRGRMGDRNRGRSSVLKPPTTPAELDARIRYRQAHSKAQNEPAVQALWQESREATTDYLKRDALRRYYKLLYQRILKHDKGLSPLVEERQRVSLRRLDQTRVEPTDPTDEEHRQRRD